MTIDLSLLRPPEEGGNSNEVLRWQLLRLSLTHDDNTSSSKNVESLIRKVSHFDAEKRRLLKEICHSRARLKQLQSLLAPPSRCAGSDAANGDIDDAKVRSEIVQLKKMIIPKLEEESEEILNTINILSPRLGNIIATHDNNHDIHHDLELEDLLKKLSMNPKCQSSMVSMVLDPLYCIGGYEKIKMPTWNDYFFYTDKRHNDIEVDATKNANGEEKVYLCGYGSMIYDAILAQLRNEMHCNYNSLKDVRVPDSIPLHSKELAHSLMGCTIKGDNELHNDKEITNCTICQCKCMNNNGQPIINAQSHIALSMLHANKSFTDRELPKNFLCTTSISPVNSSNDKKHESECLSSSSSLSLTHSINRLDCFVISTSNFKLSNEIQDEIARNIVSMYKSLLVSMSDIEQLGNNNVQIAYNINKSIPLLQIRAITPSNLKPSEARRLVIEGYFPCTGKYICLGQVTNYTDYISREIKIKCSGGQGQPNQYCHLVYAQFCDLDLLNWVMENNIVLVTTKIGNQVRSTTANSQHEQYGVMITSDIAGHITNSKKEKKVSRQSFLFIPFNRELIKRKGGKISTKEIKGPKAPIWFEINESQKSNTNKSNVNTNESKTQFALKLPSARDEAACNPYDFLPFLL